MAYNLHSLFDAEAISAEDLQWYNLTHNREGG